ncbi:flagellar basal body-associated protein FliL [Duganella sp. 3397]|nr:flagellar basal body-associated protein FliL [Duganella sp. 3397]
MRAVILVIVAVVMVVMVVAGVAAVVVMLAHASFPFDGSAICSSISLRTSLIWASAAE